MSEDEMRMGHQRYLGLAILERVLTNAFEKLTLMAIMVQFLISRINNHKEIHNQLKRPSSILYNYMLLVKTLRAQ